MKLFLLPDLGEGLPSAEIREWYIKVGDTVEIDQPLLAVETAKALVDVPAPYAGTIEKLFGEAGDTIQTGAALIGFIGEGDTEKNTTHHAKKDSGTVVGNIPESDTVLTKKPEIKKKAVTARIKATPAVRALAKALQVDLATINTGAIITTNDVKNAVKKVENYHESNLSAMQLAMHASMSRSRQQVTPLSLFDVVHFDCEQIQKNITINIIRALISACQAEPILNAQFDNDKKFLQQRNTINIGLAVDTPHGLYAPVLKDAASQSDEQLREHINRLKTAAMERKLKPSDLKDATIILSNFGVYAGRFATPVVVPPMVAIVGIGRSYKDVVVVDSEVTIRKCLPLSVTVDHRVITGGELARFMKILIESF